MTARDWRQLAACANGDPEFFFPVGNPRSRAYREEEAAAIDVCMGCPVLAECRRFAMGEEMGLPASARFGVFAAMGPAERAAADPTEKRPQGRPKSDCHLSAHHARRGIAAHEAHGEPLCSRCAAFVQRQEAKAARERQIDELIDRGHSDWWIATQTDSARDTVALRRRRRRSVAA